MVKEFTYTSNSGTKARKVLVLKENANYIGGIDLSLLPAEDAEIVSEQYKDVVPVSDFKAKITLEDFNSEWNKAYRQFAKSKIK